jgi:hypothetical protein
MKSSTLFALMLAASPAQAAPILLTCSLQDITHEPSVAGDKVVWTLEVDLSARTVTVEGFDPTPILGASSDIGTAAALMIEQIAAALKEPGNDEAKLRRVLSLCREAPR